MRVLATPTRLALDPGRPATIEVDVFNDDIVIAGYTVQVLGVDPTWVTVDGSDMALFPDTSGTITITVLAPADLPVGLRSLSIEIATRTEPVQTEIVSIELDIATDRRGMIEVRPVTIQGGRTARFSLLATNRGNAPIEFGFSAIDAEDRLWFEFDPRSVHVPPGSQANVVVEATGKRPLVGNPGARAFIVEASGADDPVNATGVFIQKPYLSRGGLGLLGLLITIGIFAATITWGFGSIVSDSDKDTDLALQIIAAQQTDYAAEIGTIGGTVRDGQPATPVRGVTVEIAKVDEPTMPLSSTATAKNGTFEFDGIPAGSYVVRFTGLGLVEQWYPGTAAVGDAEPVVIESRGDAAYIDMTLLHTEDPMSESAGGAGESEGADAGESEPLTVTPGQRIKGNVQAEGSGLGIGGVVVTATVDGADVTTVTLTEGSVMGDEEWKVGDFVFQDVAASGPYTLVVSKAGFGTEAVGVDPGADPLTIALSRTTTTVTGAVTSERPGPPPTVTMYDELAPDDDTAATVVSRAEAGADGIYALEDVPMPGTYVLEFVQAGHNSQTLVITISDVGEIEGTTDVDLRAST